MKAMKEEIQDRIPMIASGEPSSTPDRCEARFNIIKKFCPEQGVIAELGTFRGDFLHWLLRLNPSRLYAVDPWYLLYDGWHFSSTDKFKNCSLSAFINILNVYRAQIKEQRMLPVVATSQTFLRSIEDNILDLCYIDSTHTYRDTLLEIELLHSKVKHGGIIAGDDYNKNAGSGGYQVFMAVQEQLKTGRFKMAVDGESNQFVLINHKPNPFS